MLWTDSITSAFRNLGSSVDISWRRPLPDSLRHSISKQLLGNKPKTNQALSGGCIQLGPSWDIKYLGGSSWASGFSLDSQTTNFPPGCHRVHSNAVHQKETWPNFDSMLGDSTTSLSVEQFVALPLGRFERNLEVLCLVFLRTWQFVPGEHPQQKLFVAIFSVPTLRWHPAIF